MADDGANVEGSAADDLARQKLKKRYEDSWKGIDPKVRRKHEDKMYGKGNGPDWGDEGAPNDPDLPRNQPKVSPLINIPLYDNSRSPKSEK